MLYKRAVLAAGAILLVAFGFVLGTAVLPGSAFNSAEPVATFQSPVSQSIPVSLPAALGSDNLTQTEQVFSTIYDAVSPSVVSITVYAKQGNQEVPYASGSGFVIDYQGHIVTNDHVIDGADRVDVNFKDGTIASANVIAGDRDSDVAVIQVSVPQDRLVPVTFGNSDSLVVGQTVLAIGNPYRKDWTLTSGIVSAVNRTIDGLNGQFQVGAAIQTDAAINPGNSGGPLLNMKGEVIGINSQIISDSSTVGGQASSAGIGFAIPSNLVTHILPDLLAGHAVSYSYMGVESQQINLDMINQYNLPNNTQGVPVTRVTAGGPSAAAGLHSATPNSIDIITAIDGQPVTDFNSLISYLAINTRPGDTVTLTVLRDGSTQQIPVTLGSRPTQSQ